jgi:selenocysteine lyase/cysteine desulfurase
MDARAIARTRELFPITAEHVYLNHATIAPLPAPAAERMAALARTVSATGDRLWSERLREYDRVRELVARLLHARRPQEVAFVLNTSDGLAVVANGLRWRPGDNLVGALFEFPSNVYPWLRLAAQGVEYRRVPERDGRLEPEDVLRSIDERTRLVCLSWVQFAHGFRCDLARIGRHCRERGVLLAVDVAQGLGALDLDVERDAVDVCATTVHKWLLGPEGLGILYVSDRVVEELPPSRVGWRTVPGSFETAQEELRYSEGALRYESGTLNVYGAAALGASLELLLELGLEAVERRVLQLSHRLARGLEGLGFTLPYERAPQVASGIVGVTHPRHNAVDLVEKLERRRIIVAARRGFLRIAPHFYNTEEEIDLLLDALDQA